MSRTTRAIRGGVATLAVTCSVVLPSTAGAATLGTYDYLLAPTTSCTGQTSYTASVATQETAMHCLVAYARQRQGLKPLARTSLLDLSARRKAEDIVRCRQFSHTACGRAFDYWIKQVGWKGVRWGENIA